MRSLVELLSASVADAFEACGFDRAHGKVVASSRPDLGQFQCNGPLAAADQHQLESRQIAEEVVGALTPSEILRDVSVAGLGFVNLTVTDEYLARHVQAMAVDERLGCDETHPPLKIIVDYGGANIATIRAAPDTGVEVAALDRETFTSLIVESEHTKQEIAHVAQKRILENRASRRG